ncbi:ribonuclease H-like domain-containing protein [Metabacillus sp. RGM 3146]|uniref:ribonuclease H-like domain-containing protein n=1 Tax=Metabacillus sp. RGM 3146 TaxID=3401092 RepID=UPI003B996D56
MSLKNKLNRLKSHIVKEETQTDPPKKVEQPAGSDKWEEFGMSIFRYDDEYCFVREVHYPLDTIHGTARFGDFPSVVKKWNESPLDHPLSSKGHLPKNLFFFDTETTGLGGGAGNTIFLLGHARVMEDKVTVKQHLLPKPGNEVALYQSFLSEVNIKTLVTYNGKAFDWPQVKTRHTLIRDLVPELPQFGHFDLLHAAKRIWKSHLPSLKLSLVEEEILNIKRTDDIPGYLAPMIYFHFVEKQDPELIFGVMKHNELDVLTLITLYQELSLKLLNAAAEEDEKIQFELAKWFQAAGEDETAFQTFQAVSEKSSFKQFDAKLAMAQKWKKEKEISKAVELWKEIVKKGNGKAGLEAAVEMAKFEEHTKRNISNALEYTASAILMVKESVILTEEKKEKWLIELRKRRTRLERKYSRLD